MKVPRLVNVALQNFNAWQHRKVVDDNAKVNKVQQAFTTLWTDPDGSSFTPHGVTISSGDYASSATANKPDCGLI